MISQERRQEILEKLQREREIRRKLIEEGKEECFIDESIIRQPVLIQNQEDEVDLTQQSIAYNQSNMNLSTIQEEMKESIERSQGSLNQNDNMQEKRLRLQQMKKDLFEKKVPIRSDSIDRLAQPKQYDKYERYKEMEENEKIRECTFKPKISENSKYISQVVYEEFKGETVVDRMAQQDRERQQRIDELRMKSQQTSYIKPTVQLDPDAIPLHLRLADVVKEKQQNLARIQEKHSKDFEYKPVLNPQSEVLAMIRHEGVNVVDRLTQYGIQKNLRQQDAESSQHQYSFHPSIMSTRNDEIVKQLGLSENFLERQQQLQKIHFQKLNSIEEVVQEIEGCTFKPKVNELSEQMVQGKRPQDVVERLFEKERKQYSQPELFPFAPQIDANSKKLAGERTLEDLIHEDNRRKEQLRLQAEEQYRESCSFYPSTCSNPKYSQIQSPYTFDNCHDLIRQQLKCKELQRIRKLKEKEEEELKNCTFKPITNKSFVKEPLAEVRGMENYLLKVDHLNRQKQNKKQREEELFEIHKKYDKQNHKNKTQPEPFNLHNPKRKQQYSRP